MVSLNIRKRFTSVGSRLRPVAGKAKSGTKYVTSKVEKEGKYIYEKRKQGAIAREAEEQEIGIRGPSNRVKTGSILISPSGQRYIVMSSTAKYYITKSGLHIPKSKIDLFQVKQPKTPYISRISSLISTGKRTYKK